MPKITRTTNTVQQPIISGTPQSAMAAAVPSATPGQMNQDKALIALCERHATSIDRVNNCPYDIEDANDPIYREYILAREAISKAKPQSLAGLAAKAQAATREALLPNGEKDFSNGIAISWASDLVADIIRLAGGVA